MPEAHVVRSLQQNRLIDSLVKKYRDRLEQLAETIKITDPEEFEKRAKRQRDWFTNTLLIMMHTPLLRNPWTENPLVYAFLAQIRADISQFSRAPEETIVLQCRFLREIVRIQDYGYEAALRSLEISDPQKIFHAPSAMTKMEIPEDV